MHRSDCRSVPAVRWSTAIASSFIVDLDTHWLEGGGELAYAVDVGDDLLVFLHCCCVEVATGGQLVEESVALKHVEDRSPHLLGRGNTRDMLEVLVGQREADDFLRLAVALLSVPVVVGILRRRLLLDDSSSSRSDRTSESSPSTEK